MAIEYDATVRTLAATIDRLSPGFEIAALYYPELKDESLTADYAVTFVCENGDEHTVVVVGNGHCNKPEI